jgi:hypothetical protein
MIPSGVLDRLSKAGFDFFQLPGPNDRYRIFELQQPFAIMILNQAVHGISVGAF